VHPALYAPPVVVGLQAVPWLRYIKRPTSMPCIHGRR